jgi:hypothetical protein
VGPDWWVEEGKLVPSAALGTVSNMTFTPLLQALGRPPGPITDEMLDEAVAGGYHGDRRHRLEAPGSGDQGLPQSDFPKDVAAMANSGGGVLVFGIEEGQKVAIGRLDVGEMNEETYGRALRSAAVTAIHPPIFGLQVEFLGDKGKRAVAVVVTASLDGPHLIYRNEYFGAPIRNDADTVWMRERQVEQMYRARFDEQRHLNEALDAVYAETTAGKPIQERAGRTPSLPCRARRPGPGWRWGRW